MFIKPKIVVAALATMATTLLVLTQTAATPPGPASYKLEGAWIAKVPTTPLQWSYVFSPSDPSGRRATLSGSLQVSIPAALIVPGFPEFDYSSPSVGEAVMTGPDTAKFTAVGYSIKKVAPSPEYPFLEQVTVIWVTSGEVKFTAPGKTETTHHVAYYLPAADGNGDGLPDEGSTPFACLPPTTSIDTQVGLMPPCTPTPPTEP